jgi:hypothetical protein
MQTSAIAEVFKLIDTFNLKTRKWFKKTGRLFSLKDQIIVGLNNGYGSILHRFTPTT